MAVLAFLFVSLLAAARSSIIPSPLPAPGLAHGSSHALTGTYSAAGTRHSGLGIVQPVPIVVIATNNDQSDGVKTVKEVVAGVADKVADVVADVIDHGKDVVDDLIGKVKDKVSDIVDQAKDGGTSNSRVHKSHKTNAGSNETIDDSSDVDAVEDDSTEQVTNGGNSTESARSSKEEDDSHKNQDGGSSHSINSKEHNSTRNNDNSNEDIKGSNSNGQSINETQDSGEHHRQDKKGDTSADKDTTRSVWSWLKDLANDRDDDSEDDDSKMKRYLTQMSKIRGYLDAIDSSIAASQAKQTGTCPIYPVQVGVNRVTITTQTGCKIIIKLKGVTVDKIEDGRIEDKSKIQKRSVVVSYAGNN